MAPFTFVISYQNSSLAKLPILPLLRSEEEFINDIQYLNQKKIMNQRRANQGKEKCNLYGLPLTSFGISGKTLQKCCFVYLNKVFSFSFYIIKLIHNFESLLNYIQKCVFITILNKFWYNKPINRSKYVQIKVYLIALISSVLCRAFDYNLFQKTERNPSTNLVFMLDWNIKNYVKFLFRIFNFCTWQPYCMFFIFLKKHTCYLN